MYMNETPLKIKKIMRNLFFLLLALPMFAAAQAQLVQVPTCRAGTPFTIRIPVRFPDSLAVQYAWYRNDTLVEDSHTLMLGEKTIAYTVPADKAHGDSVAFHFKYRLNDGCEEWSHSPRYLLNFQTICPPIPGIASVAALPCDGGVSSPGVASVTAYSCSGGISSAGTASVTAYSCSGGVSNAGTASIAPY